MIKIEVYLKRPVQVTLGNNTEEVSKFSYYEDFVDFDHAIDAITKQLAAGYMIFRFSGMIVPSSNIDIVVYWKMNSEPSEESIAHLKKYNDGLEEIKKMSAQQLYEIVHPVKKELEDNPCDAKSGSQ